MEETYGGERRMRAETKFQKIIRFTQKKCIQFEPHEVHRIIYELVDTLIKDDFIEEFNREIGYRREEIIQELKEEAKK
jgi:uncharacterized protein YbbC (DUF1343 family)